MSTTILTDEQIMACLVNLAETTKSVGIGNLYLESDAVPIGRAIEQAVLKSIQWQPIASAPRDGTWIAGWRRIAPPFRGNPLVFVRWFDFDDEPGWAWPAVPYDPWTLEGQELAIKNMEEGDWFASDDFTHWMPLPMPPSDAAMEKQP